LTLTGAGGCGKTRLALELASSVQPAYPDGVWWAELGSVTEADFVAQQVASVLKVSESKGGTLLNALVGRTADRSMLLVLDNCEHLIDPCAMLAETLLAGGQNLRIVVTSREALNIQGELVWRVPSLQLPNNAHSQDVSSLAACEAVALFVDRSRMARPHFELTSKNAASVAEICKRLDGIPLAIELAAAHSHAMNPLEIAGRLDDRFRLLTRGRRTGLPRQQTLRASIDWSYALLTTKERTLLQRLSVFAGSFDLDVVEEVCSGAGIEAVEVVSVLGRLVDKSVVQVEPPTGTLSRFRLLETVKEYAGELLIKSGEAESLQRRQRHHFVALSKAAQTGLAGPEQTAWIERIDAENDDLRAALRRDLVADPSAALAIVAALKPFWSLRGYLSEGRSWLERALDASRDPSPARTQALIGAGQLAFEQADFGDAKARFDAALRDARAADDHSRVSVALVGLAAMALATGDADGSRAILHDAIAISRQVGDPLLLVPALSQLGMVAAQQGEADEADRLASEAIALSRASGNLLDLARGLLNKVIVSVLRRDSDSLRVAAEEGLMVSRKLRTPSAMALFLEAYATIALGERRYSDALRLGAAAVHVREEVRASMNPVWIATVEQWTLGPARDAVGKQVAADAWAEGLRLSAEEAIALALSQTPDPTKRFSTIGIDPLALSKREQAIATLVAEGLTNLQIANTLFISKRTVETHVQHIFNKLGVSSRASIAAWAVAQRLVTVGSTAAR
jgi:predicted ATPase/DNA-binding CsgD family transcriptional regulator